MKFIAPFAVVVAVLLSLPVAAQVHKCTGADGKVTYSQSPCAAEAPGSEIRLRTAPPSDLGDGGGTSGLRPGELEILERAAEEREAAAAARAEQRYERERIEEEAEIHARTQLRLEQCARDRGRMSYLRSVQPNATYERRKEISNEIMSLKQWVDGNCD